MQRHIAADHTPTLGTARSVRYKEEYIFVLIRGRVIFVVLKAVGSFFLFLSLSFSGILVFCFRFISSDRA